MAALIRGGHICRHCTNKKCVDENTDHEPTYIDCTECNGSPEGCEHCDQGKWRPDGLCPNRYCSDVAPVVRLIEMFNKHGMPPITGGVLDQSAWFINAAWHWENEKAQIEAELNR